MRSFPFFIPVTASAMIVAESVSCIPQDGAIYAEKGRGFFVQGDWLYWKTGESGLGYVLNQQQSNIFSDPATDAYSLGFGEIANPKFDWESGFRGGLGYTTPEDRWDLILLWTCYEGKGSDRQTSAGNDDSVLFPVFLHPNDFNDQAIVACKDASYQATIQLNVLDWDLGKTFFAGKRVSLHPHFGLRSAWVHQIHNIEYTTLFDQIQNEVLKSYSTHAVNNFWGLGPRGGFGADFSLGLGLSFTADLAVSLLYGNFDNSYSERFSRSEEDTPDATIADSDIFHAGRVVTDVQLAMRWQRPFAGNKIRFLLQAGWEHHMFFSQNQIPRFVDGQNWGVFVQNQGDLYFQGWTGSARLFF